jgi:hypothetical protein
MLRKMMSGSYQPALAHAPADADERPEW